MQATAKRYIKSGVEFNHLIPKPDGERPVIHPDGDVEETVGLMITIIDKYKGDTAKLAKVLQDRSLIGTCRNIWNFIYQHIQYTPDTVGIEELRRPARAWADRRTGVDCDCYSIFAGSILANLNIPFKLRITKYYNRPKFQHVYVVVPFQNTEIIIDPVTDSFNYEKPYTGVKDTKYNPMLNGIPIQLLNGLEGEADVLEVTRLVTGEDLKGVVSGLGTLEDQQADIKKYLERTVNVLQSSPDTFKKVGGGEYVELLKRAIAAWDTDSREAVLDKLEVVENSLIAKGIVLPGMEGIDEENDPYVMVSGLGNLNPNLYVYRPSGINGELGKLFKKGGFISRIKDLNKKVIDIHKKVIKKGIDVNKKILEKTKEITVNLLTKWNPVMIMVRLGFIFPIRINLFKWADKLKYGLLTPEQAKTMDLDDDQYQKAVDLYKNVEHLWTKVLFGKAHVLRGGVLRGKRKNFLRDLPEPSDEEMEAIDKAEFNPEELKRAKEIPEDEKDDLPEPDVQATEGFGYLGEAASGAAAGATAVGFLGKAWQFIKNSGLKVSDLFKSNPEKKALKQKYGRKKGKYVYKMLKASPGSVEETWAKKWDQDHPGENPDAGVMSFLSKDKDNNFLKNAKDIIQTGQDLINPGQEEQGPTRQASGVGIFDVIKRNPVISLAIAGGIGYGIYKLTQGRGSKSIPRPRKAGVSGLDGLEGTRRKKATAKTAKTVKKHAKKLKTIHLS
jgi:hypothetical protein